MRQSRRRSGFSMLELLVVVVIGGMMAKLSMGRIHDLMSHERVLHAATAIQNDLESAFQIAARNRQPIRIEWDASTQQISVKNRSGASFRKINLGQQSYGFLNGAVTVSSSPIEVYPNGLASDTLRITLTSNGFTKSLRMSRAGLVQYR
jgi:prepilin-type N-terminal cleavage/methylation domain-containing protein